MNAEISELKIRIRKLEENKTRLYSFISNLSNVVTPNENTNILITENTSSQQTIAITQRRNSGRSQMQTIPIPIQKSAQLLSSLTIREKLERKNVIIPNEYLCPITMDLINDPVMLEDGIIYENEAITRWLRTNNKSPITRMVINKNIKIKCITMKKLIEDFVNKNLNS